MFPNMAGRIAYGRRIQNEAEVLMSSHGASAIDAASSWAGAAGLTQDDEAFRRAVEARVARMMGKKTDSRAA